MSWIVPHSGKRSEKNRPPPPSSVSARANKDSSKPRKIRNVTTPADYAELERCYTFVPSSESSTWQDRMVKHYHSHLYKEYVLADLRRAGQVGLRWRTQQEVEIGKGHSTCGNKHCPSYENKPDSNDQALAAYYHHSPVAPSTETEEELLLDRVPYGLGLHDYEVNFAYVEGAVPKNELIKLRLCLRCAPQLFHSKGGALGARKARLTMDEKVESRNVNVENNETNLPDSVHSNESSSEEDSVAYKKQKSREGKRRRKTTGYTSSNDDMEAVGVEESDSNTSSSEKVYLTRKKVKKPKRRRKGKKRRRKKESSSSSGSDDDSVERRESDKRESRRHRRSGKGRTKSKHRSVNILLTLCIIVSLVSVVDAFQHAVVGKVRTTVCLNSERPVESTSAAFNLKSNRMPLGKLFEKRNFIFSTVRNIRSYEWTEKETEELWDDIADEALMREQKQDYELQQIILVPTFWDTHDLGTGERFDVHDGQQRLVTLALLIAALRDSLRSKYAKDGDELSVNELANMLNPPKARKSPVLRIEMRQREAAILEKILIPEMDKTGLQVDLPRPKDRKSLSDTGKRIVKNYELLLDRAQDLTLKDMLVFIDYLQERVYLLVSVYTESRMARNVVMGQGKGKDNQPIDHFKGLVCYREIYAEEDQNDVFEKWDDLASDENVGRKNVADACLLLASAQLRTKVKKNEEIDMMEKWLKQELESKSCDGREFFEQVIDPACKKLKAFREGGVDVATMQGASNDQSLQRKIARQLMFLRAASKVATAKEIEAVVLHQLVQKPPAGLFERQLEQLELTALWMMLAKPKPAIRSRRCFELLDQFAEPGSYELQNAVSVDEIVQIKDAMETFGFGPKQHCTQAAAAAILERLDAHLLCQRSQSFMPVCTELQVEHILPKKPQGEYWDTHWPDNETRRIWTHRLGNLALLNQKANAKASNNGFSSKRDHYNGSPYPMTNKLQCVQVWNLETVEKRHKDILNLANEVWGL